MREYDEKQEICQCKIQFVRRPLDPAWETIIRIIEEAGPSLTFRPVIAIE